MTPRSPKQHSKTTLISRRYRTRADQNLSVQPPEVPQSRNNRPRRAATLPTPHFSHLHFQGLNSQPTPRSWDSSDTSENTQQSSILGTSASRIVNPTNLLTDTVDFGAYEPQGPLLVPASDQTARPAQSHRANHTLSSELPTSPDIPISGGPEFGLSLSTEPIPSQTPFVNLQDMSTLDYMMAPSQYSMHHYASPSSYSPNYPPVSQQGYGEHRSSTSGSFDSSYAVSSTLPHDHRRHDEQTILPPYGAQQPSLSRNSYQQQQPLSSLRSGSAPAVSSPQAYPYPATHNSVPSQSLGSNASTYPPPALYPPTTYGVSEYHPLPTMYPPTSTASTAYASYEAPLAANQPSPTHVPSLSSSPNAQGSGVAPRAMNTRPKPQCWEHGCNGRQFSTFSNLLRHQREKSGTASKSYCPRCGAEFTRTTARNGHMAHDKCKPRRPSETER